MTINEAILKLAYLERNEREYGDIFNANALKLGIEALKRIKHDRSHPGYNPLELLPGETE